MPDFEGRTRVVVEGVSPEVDGGRFPIKRVAGDRVVVEANAFADGHDAIACAVRFRREDATGWEEAPLRPLENDRWRGSFLVPEVGRYRYTVIGWIDRFRTWRNALSKKVQAGQEVEVEILEGIRLVQEAGEATDGKDADRLAAWAENLARTQDPTQRIGLALSAELADLMQANPDRRHITVYERELAVVVDVPKARFSAWYEMFPRSTARGPGEHGTFKACEARLPYVAGMGFDVLYFPPIHPIGRAHRKGRNNAATAGPDDPGSPWAIGAAEGGHKAVHPPLGTLEDFRQLVAKAKEVGIDIALDLAFQCTPDHPYVERHPEWFRTRSDGSIQYAENPPKKYQDIFPFDFESDRWEELWVELEAVVRFWIDQGVRIFRVDNPHTKPFGFWEWLIGDLKRDHPDLIFLAEAFTRPKVMYRLAKIGFTQSYTYFAWRNTKGEIERYFTELTRTEVREFFRPNLWPNTPDILTEFLQMGGRPAFLIRLFLAATLGASYGVYGPAFELCENEPREWGSEEYLDSEKYEIRTWDLSPPENLRGFIQRINQIRRENPALQTDRNLLFHPVDNEQLIAYSKHTDDRSNIVLTVVNLDPHHAHAGWVDLPLDRLGLDPDRPYQGHDLIQDVRFLWTGARNFVELDPKTVPAHVFRIRKRIRTERDFDYFM